MGAVAMSREIGLVSCVKTKRDSAAPPQDLYISSYFEKMREYAERNHDEWLIMSAKHGILEPGGDPIEPYEQTLNGTPVAERRQWARDVFEDLVQKGLLGGDVTLVVHAGKSYYGELLPLLKDTAVSVEIPTDGLQIGDTLAWYNERL